MTFCNLQSTTTAHLLENCHMAMLVLKNGCQKYTCHHSRFNSVDNWACMSWLFQRESVMTRDVHQGMWVICGCSLNLSSMWSALFTESQPFDRIGKYYWIRLVLAIHGECHYKFKDSSWDSKSYEMPNKRICFSWNGHWLSRLCFLLTPWTGV